MHSERKKCLGVRSKFPKDHSHSGGVRGKNESFLKQIRFEKKNIRGEDGQRVNAATPKDVPDTS